MVHGMIITTLTMEILWQLTPRSKIPPSYYGLPEDDEVVWKTHKIEPVIPKVVAFEDPQVSERRIPPKMSICGCEK